MNHTVLLIDDNVPLVLSLKQALAPAYQVQIAQTGRRALELIADNRYNCILLDLGLPDMSGHDVCGKLRQSGNTVPIIVMSGDSDVAQKARMLDAGADDYLTKPVDLTELEARIRTVIRRARSAQSLGSHLHINGVVLDSLRHRVERDGMVVHLRPKEFSLLECLMNNAGHVVSRPVLLQYAWDDNTDIWTNVVDVHIKYLRDKLDYPFSTPLIQTVHGLGYKFDASTVANTMKGGKHNERTITNRSH